MIIILCSLAVINLCLAGFGTWAMFVQCIELEDLKRRVDQLTTHRGEKTDG